MPAPSAGMTRESPAYFNSLHELVGEETVVRLQRFVRLEQPSLDVETFRLLERIRGEPQVTGRDLANVLERDRELAIIELREAFLEQRQRLVRPVEHHGRRLTEGRADPLAQCLALRAGVGLR